MLWGVWPLSDSVGCGAAVVRRRVSESWGCLGVICEGSARNLGEVSAGDLRGIWESLGAFLQDLRTICARSAHDLRTICARSARDFGLSSRFLRTFAQTFAEASRRHLGIPRRRHAVQFCAETPFFFHEHACELAR